MAKGISECAAASGLPSGAGTGAWYALFQKEAGKLRWLIGKEPSAGQRAGGEQRLKEHVTARRRECGPRKAAGERNTQGRPRTEKQPQPRLWGGVFLRGLQLVNLKLGHEKMGESF